MKKPDPCHEAWLKIKNIPRHATTPEKAISEWVNGPGKIQYEAFRNQYLALAQSEHVAEADIIAWIWSFYHDPDIKELSVEDRRRYLLGAVSGMRKLSAYDAGVVASEMSGEYNFSFKSAESVRRAMLLKDVYAAIPARSETRLRNLARERMKADTLRAVARLLAKDDAFSRIEMLEGKEGDTIAAHSNRYAFIRAEFTGKPDMWVPCLFVADNDASKEKAYFYELAAICGTFETVSDIVGVAICTIDPGNFSLTTRVLPVSMIEPYIGRVKECTEKFLAENVLRDIPLPPPAAPEGMRDLAGEELEKFKKLSREIATLSILRKSAEDKEKALRKELKALVRNFAKVEGITEHQVHISAGNAMAATRFMSIDFEALDGLVMRNPEICNHIFGSVKPDPDLMEKKLREIGVDERYWCSGTPDAKLIEEFCRTHGLRAPLTPRVTFRLTPGVKQELMEERREGFEFFGLD